MPDLPRGSLTRATLVQSTAAASTGETPGRPDPGSHLATEELHLVLRQALAQSSSSCMIIQKSSPLVGWLDLHHSDTLALLLIFAIFSLSVFSGHELTTAA